MGAIERIEPTLLAIATRCLRLRAGELDPDAPLACYGLDSLTAVELGVAISEATGLEVTEDALLDAASLNDLARHLARRDPEPAGVLDAMYADARLAADIDPTAVPAACSDTVLLTGATGFLGVHLLDEVSKRSRGTVVCLVRAVDDADARARLRATCAAYGVSAEVLDRRVHAIAAEIALPYFGLAETTYRQLASEVAAVYHCAAAVNWTQGYAFLRAANVAATRGLIRFACEGVRKRLDFVSSVAACYSTNDTGPVREDAPTPDAAGIHFGYGQSKWVAERLIEAAARRGLDACIHRPSLIAGSSASGIGNDDDFLALMISGSVALGLAPDIDWRIDACPVDFAARAIAASRCATASRRPVMHLCNPRPARWSEVVLWLNLRGYPVRLAPFDEWVVQADLASRDATHPLHRLRGFLLKRPFAGDRRYLPEFYAHPHVQRFDAGASDAFYAEQAILCPALNAGLLERYVDRWVERGVLGRAPRRRERRSTDAPCPGADAAIEHALRERSGDERIAIRRSSVYELGTQYSILGELAAWHRGSALRLHGRRIEIERAGAAGTTLDIVVKPKVASDAVLDVTHAVAAQCSPALAEAFARYRPYCELRGTETREIAMYTGVCEAEAAYRPCCYGVATLDGCSVLLLERIERPALIDAVDDIAAWTPVHIRAALRGIANLHARYLDRADEVSARIGTDPTAVDPAAAGAWYRALSDYARPFLNAWIGPQGAGVQARLAGVAGAATELASVHPRTLIHHDFNPRNIALRATPAGPELCAYDWELVTYGLPQRDAAELLCFVLPEDFGADAPAAYLDHHRGVIEARSGQRVDARAWNQGVGLALADFGVRRLPLYLLAHRFRPQAFLPRVARTWARLITMWR